MTTDGTQGLRKVNQIEQVPVATEPIFTGEVQADIPATFAPVIWLLHSHGGCGATTLAKWLEPAAETDIWPVCDEYPNVAIVAKYTLSGVAAAHQRVLQAQNMLADQLNLLGVVLVPDTAGKPEKEIRERCKTLTNLTTVLYAPYIAAARTTDLRDLAAWNPVAKLDHSRKAKRLSLKDQVPISVADLGQKLFDLAKENY